jgi:hypothetical protein
MKDKFSMYVLFRQADLENRLKSADQENRLMSERLERMKGEREVTENEAQEKDVELQSAISRASLHQSATSINDAHLWWSYIWHAMKQQQEQFGASYPRNTGTGSGDSLSKVNATAGNEFISEIGAAALPSAAGDAFQAGTYEFVPSTEPQAIVHQARLRDNIRSQAIEITKLRQVSLKTLKRSFFYNFCKF